MANIKNEYQAVQTLTITLASLASSATAGREATKVDNTSNKYLDALVIVKVKTQNSGTIGSDKAIYVYAYGSLDATTYPDTTTGADAAITLNDPTQLRLIGVISAVAINTTYKGGPWGVAQAFGGVLPQYWGIVVRNYSGTALSATAGDHSAQYTGVYQSVT